MHFWWYSPRGERQYSCLRQSQLSPFAQRLFHLLHQIYLVAQLNKDHHHLRPWEYSGKIDKGRDVQKPKAEQPNLHGQEASVFSKKSRDSFSHRRISTRILF